jgi:hypothetical protein
VSGQVHGQRPRDRDWLREVSVFSGSAEYCTREWITPRMKSTLATRSPHASTQPGERANQDRRPQPSRHHVDQRSHLLRGRDIGALLRGARRGPPRTRWARDQPVMHGITHDLRQAAVQRVDVGHRRILARAGARSTP